MSGFNIRALWTRPSPRARRARKDRIKREEYRIWVDHEALEACIKDKKNPILLEHERYRIRVDHKALETYIKDKKNPILLERLWSQMGLDVLDPRDPDIPRDLARLLRAYDHDSSFSLFVPGIILSVLGEIILQFNGYSAPFGAWTLMFMTAFAFILTRRLPTIIKKFISYFLPLTRSSSRLLRALKPLRERPFVIVVDGMLIQNLPSLSWLNARTKELGNASIEAQHRERALKDTAKQIRATRDDLGESGADAALDRLGDAIQTQKDLEMRIAKLQEEISRRTMEIRSKFDPLLARIKLERLHRQSAVLTGTPDVHIPEQISADLEMDVADLNQGISGLRRDLIEQEQRFMAMNEVSSISP